MSLRDLDIKISYTSHGEKNIANDLINPALKVSRIYKRSVGFFSSSVIELLVDGLKGFAENGEKIQLITSTELSDEDIQTISLAYEHRANIINASVEKKFENSIELLDDDKLLLLYELIKNGVLDIKIAITKTNGMYHDKFGILQDFTDNTVVFYGSANSSKHGYKDNYEKIRVVKSWVPGNMESVEDELKEFDMLWKNKNPHVDVMSFKKSAEEKVLHTINRRKSEKKKADPKNSIVLRDYQKAAIQAWVNNNYHGFYVMATGTGKTWTAIFSAKELVNKEEAMIVICAPYKHLVKQWAEDVKIAFPEAVLIMVSSENPQWETQLSEAIVRQRLRKNTQIIVISTISSFFLDRCKKTLSKSKQNKLLIVDEAHRFTARSEELKNEFGYMLGLSATPFSGKNTEKGLELMQFFGGQVFNLPIEDALERGFLVPYNYIPIFVCATSEEEENFKKKTAQIAGCFRNGKCIDPDGLVLHLRARLRLISMAEEKMNQIDSILQKVKERDHFIVYCGDGRLHDDNDEEIRHIQFVKRKLGERGFKASQFTASENMFDRMNLVELFNEGEIDSLAAIRCLDEGINIPSITGALILSSNDDYREFVQRRGRILRTYKDKKFANIYDVVVLPSLDTPKMAEIELRRFYEYARLALNQDEMIKQLEAIADQYGIELEQFVSTFDDTKEAELDE